jgi:hypothetical protein
MRRMDLIMATERLRLVIKNTAPEDRVFNDYGWRARLAGRRRKGDGSRVGSTA